MNYLAHLHIAEFCRSSLAGNLLGDFVKGDPAKQFSPSLSNGIRLHRFVDSYTDSHDVARSCKALFSKETRRFAPIALDVFWDHFLAKDWHNYHSLALGDFCSNAHEKIDSEIEIHWPERFKFVHEKMWQGEWLKSYRELESIELVLDRMATRRPKLEPLRHCYSTIENEYETLQRNFELIYPDILEKAHEFNRQTSA